MFVEYVVENEKLVVVGYQKIEGVEEGLFIVLFLFVSVYKIFVKFGDIIKFDEQNLVELEVMKIFVSWVLLIFYYIGIVLINGLKVFVYVGEGMSGK